MTSFTDKDISALKQCPKCHKWTTLRKKGLCDCWNCGNQFKEGEGEGK